jgi:hypothetical protein
MLVVANYQSVFLKPTRNLEKLKKRKDEITRRYNSPFLKLARTKNGKPTTTDQRK